jgi:DNA-cytosine methyltransferase
MGRYAMKILDLFAGIGGFSLGLEKTGGFETVGFVEWNETAQTVLRKHWSNVPIFGDIKKVTRSSLWEAGIKHVDVLTGGFPCTDLSGSGGVIRKGLEGEASGLVYEFGRLAKELEPEWIIIENVPQIQKYKPQLEEIFNGYKLTYTNTDALEYGAYCRRKRTFIIGHSRTRGGREVCFYPTHNRPPLRTGGSKDFPPMLLPWKGGASLERLASCIIEDTQTNASRIRKGAGIPRSVGDGKFYLMLGNSLSPLITEVIGNAILDSSHD